MSPWWLRPPADEPVGDENQVDPFRKEKAGIDSAADGAAVDSPGKETAPSEPAVQGSQRTSRRRPQRGGQARRDRRPDGEADASPTPSRPRRRGRRSSPANKNRGTAPNAAAGDGKREEANGASKSPDRPPLEDRRLAVICDLESATLGARESAAGRFDINLVQARLLDKGKIVVKRAYADWDRHRDDKRSFHQAGVELIDIPQLQPSGQGGAGIRIAVDAMELCYSKQHLDTFVLISGDGDLIPLVSKLKANGKHVIGVGSSESAAPSLIDNCDEYLLYEDVRRLAEVSPQLGNVEESRVEVYTLLVEAIEALMRENQQTLWGSVVKQTIQRKHPSFNESHHGFSSFSKMLEEAEAAGVIKIRRDQKSGSYVVAGFGPS